MEQAWIFERLAVTLVRTDFVDPDHANQDDARERGVRIEIREVVTTYTGSIYSSPARVLKPAVCRIDLLESAAYAADRMHWHPVMNSGEPGDRTFDATMVKDPLRWLNERLRQVDLLLGQAGVTTDGQMGADIDTLRAVTPAIVDAAERGLEWARVRPWPGVVHDDRGLALNS